MRLPERIMQFPVCVDVIGADCAGLLLVVVVVVVVVVARLGPSLLAPWIMYSIV